MSNFECEKCGTICYDTPSGYITGCEHYPTDINVINYRKRENADKGVGCSRTYDWAYYHRIIKVLEDVADKEINLGSETGREFLAEKIMEALDK